MENINWLLIGITSVMTGFIVFMRITEYMAHQKALRTYQEKGTQLKVLFEDKKTIWMYVGMTVLVLAASWIIEGSLLERLTMSVVFALLIGSEVLNAMAQSKLYVSTKEFVYGQYHEKFRNIRSYEAKGKRSTKIHAMNKVEILLPNAYAEALKNYIQSIKDTKK